jgi:hypothetical protein
MKIRITEEQLSSLTGNNNHLLTEQWVMKNVDTCYCNNWDPTTQVCSNQSPTVLDLSLEQVGGSGLGPMVSPQVGDKFCAQFTSGTNTGLAANCGGGSTSVVSAVNGPPILGSGMNRYLLLPTEPCEAPVIYTDIIATECDGTGGGLFPCMHLDGNWATTSNIGDVFMKSPPWSGGIPPSNSKTPYIITGFGSSGTQCTTPTSFVHTINGCPGTQAPCNSGAWSNYSNWVTNWPDPAPLTPFDPNNPNPLQPCNHICQRIIHWTTNWVTSGPYQQNVLACKIDEGNNQANIHGCTC